MWPTLECSTLFKKKERKALVHNLLYSSNVGIFYPKSSRLFPDNSIFNPINFKFNATSNRVSFNRERKREREMINLIIISFRDYIGTHACFLLFPRNLLIEKRRKKEIQRDTLLRKKNIRYAPPRSSTIYLRVVSAYKGLDN